LEKGKLGTTKLQPRKDEEGAVLEEEAGVEVDEAVVEATSATALKRRTTEMLLRKSKITITETARKITDRSVDVVEDETIIETTTTLSFAEDEVWASNAAGNNETHAGADVVEEVVAEEGAEEWE